VAPKKKALEAALLVLDDQMAKLREKQAELKEVTDKLEALNDDLENKQTEKQVMCTVCQIPLHAITSPPRQLSCYCITWMNIKLWSDSVTSQWPLIIRKCLQLGSCLNEIFQLKLQRW